MKVLVTGGTGVVGTATVTALLERGHSLRLLSRNAPRDVKQWRGDIEPFQGDVSDGKTIIGAAEGCEALLHIVGIVAERPPERTFERVNVEGTRNALAEADRAGVGSFIYVSSLGAERGESEYHKSKLRGEELVRQFRKRWLIVRIGNVYGPGDDEISLLLRMVRTLPAVPVLGAGDQKFQPIWHEDVGQALAASVERANLTREALDVTGPDTITQNELVQRLAKLTDRQPARVPVPGFLASIGAKVAKTLNVPLPFTDDQLTMLEEGNRIADPMRNALETKLGVTPTPLDVGLRKLVDSLPEQLPSEGVGTLARKRFSADILGSDLGPEALFERFKMGFSRYVPIETAAEPGASPVPELGATLTMELPIRGHIQVRVAEVGPRVLTLVTLEGHPLAGAVRFLAEQRGDAVRFEIQVYDRPASTVDYLLMSAGGNLLQNANWVRVVDNVIEASGGVAPDDVETETESLDEEQTERIEEWLRELIQERQREEHDPSTTAEPAAPRPVTSRSGRGESEARG